MGRTVTTVLHLEDSDIDAEFVRDRLDRAGLAVEVERVTDRKGFVAKLRAGRYDVILSDYRVPTFEGLAALELAREHQPETPFIFVSGTMGEELAVETLTRGATDYVLKQRLIRLPAVVERAVAEAKLRAGRRAAEARAAALLENMGEGLFVLDPEFRIDYVNAAAERMTGRRREDLLGRDFRAALPDAAGAAAEPDFRRVMRTRETVEFETYYAPQDRWFSVKAYPEADGGICVQYRDVHGVKLAEAELTRRLASEARNAALLGRVAEASRAINSVLSVDGIARILADEGRAIAGAGRAVVTVAAGDGSNRTVTAVSRAGAADVSRDGAADPARGERAGLAVPLVGHDAAELGRVELAEKGAGEFTAEDRAVLAQLAAIAAVGIENARLYESVREANRRKDEFLATLAHELRNPLAPIRTGLSVLRARYPAGGDEGVLGMMERQLGHLVHLVDDLLDVSRVTTGKITLRRERLDLRDAVGVAVETSRPLVAEAGHRLTVSLPEAEVPVVGDRTRLAQVFTNILNNAAKYTPPGGRIEVAAAAAGRDAEVRVTDSGAGIPADMLPRVFEVFTQVGRTIDRAQGGLGLGLAIVKRLVEMHGGTVRADSDGPGRGSSFVVRLPLAAAETPGADPGRAPPADPPAAPRRILIVDDNTDAADCLAMLLEVAGHRAETAYSGPAAVEAAREFKPEVVLLDIGLPGMNGYEVARALRADPAQARTVLVALTGWGSEEDKRIGRESGFDFHLTKPADSEKILALIGRL